jgi:hypothetical protein
MATQKSLTLHVDTVQCTHSLNIIALERFESFVYIDEINKSSQCMRRIGHSFDNKTAHSHTRTHPHSLRLTRTRHHSPLLVGGFAARILVRVADFGMVYANTCLCISLCASPCCLSRSHVSFMLAHRIVLPHFVSACQCYHLYSEASHLAWLVSPPIVSVQRVSLHALSCGRESCRAKTRL